MIRTSAILLCSVLILALTLEPAFAGGAAAVQKSAENTANEIKGDIVTAREGWKLINQGALLIDVRSADEYKDGNIEGSLNIPHTEIAALTAAIGPDKERAVVVYCRTGRRSGHAQKELEKLGYTGIFNATGLEALEATRP